MIPSIFPKRPLPGFSFSLYLLCTSSNPSPIILLNLCCSGASAGPVLAGKTLPLQVATLISTVFSLYIVLQNFFAFLLLILYEEIWIYCLVVCMFCLMNPCSCSLLYPSNLFRGLEKNAVFVEACFKIPVYFHDYLGYQSGQSRKQFPLRHM